MKNIRNLIGQEKSLHIQVVENTYPEIISDAYSILDKVDSDVYIKIPVTEDGLRAIRELKKDNVKITATAIYSEIQALLAMQLDVEYLALYVNRMESLNVNPFNVINRLSNQIKVTESRSKILGASFKNVNQVTSSIYHGATHVTVGEDVLETFLINYNVTEAVKKFSEDWYDIYSKYKI